MTIVLDEREMKPGDGEAQTLGNAMAWVQAKLRDSGKVVIKVEVGGKRLDGPQLDANLGMALAGQAVAFSTASRVQVSHGMLGKLAAVVDFLGRQHSHIAGLLEKGEMNKAMELLGGAISAWGQVQQGFASLTTLLRVSLDTLPVDDRHAVDVINDFRQQLEEIRAAIESRDYVLLSDILQYEMDRAVTNWKAMLAAMLGVVGVEEG